MFVKVCRVLLSFSAWVKKKAFGTTLMTLSVQQLYLQNNQHGTVLYDCQNHFCWLVFSIAILILTIYKYNFFSYVKVTDHIVGVYEDKAGSVVQTELGTFTLASRRVGSSVHTLLS